MRTFWQDLRYAVRMLVKRPGFTFVVVLTLELGIGAVAAIFSFVNALLLTPLPYKDADRLVRVMSERGGETGKLSMLEVEDLRRQARLFEDFASIRNTQYNVTGIGPPESLGASVNSYNLFDLLGVKAHIGGAWPQAHERQRIFNIVLGYDVWQQRFGGDPQIVGKTIMLDAAGYEVLVTLTQAVKQAVWKVDPEQSVFDVQGMEQRVLATVWQQRSARFRGAVWSSGRAIPPDQPARARRRLRRNLARVVAESPAARCRTGA